MRRLIITNTYYQLIFAIQLRQTFFANDDISLIVSDHSNNSKIVAERIKQEGLFNNTFYVESLSFLKKEKKFASARQFVDYCFKKETKSSILYLNRLDDLFFDELLVFNVDRYILNIFSTLSFYNKRLSVSHFEEGVLSYNSKLHCIITPKRKIMDFVRRAQGKPQFTKSGENFYCFYPELYKGELSPVKVPLIGNNSETTYIIKKVFNVNLSENDYKEKYIFFTSVYDFEGEHPVGEFELVCKIADLVGKDNMLIKIHPRDRRTIYADNGFKVDKNSNIPWEAIQLTGSFKDKVFLTATSGSVLSGSFMSSDSPRTYYLYELCKIDGNTIAEESRKSIVDLLSNKKTKTIFSNVRIAESLEDIK